MDVLLKSRCLSLILPSTNVTILHNIQRSLLDTVQRPLYTWLTVYKCLDKKKFVLRYRTYVQIFFFSFSFFFSHSDLCNKEKRLNYTGGEHSLHSPERPLRVRSPTRTEGSEHDLLSGMSMPLRTQT